MGRTSLDVDGYGLQSGKFIGINNGKWQDRKSQKIRESKFFDPLRFAILPFAIGFSGFQSDI